MSKCFWRVLLFVPFIVTLFFAIVLLLFGVKLKALDKGKLGAFASWMGDRMVIA